MTKPPKRPRDFSQAAKFVVDVATGQREDREPTPEERGKDPAAAAMGRKGGAARAKSMSPERRAEIARKAAQKRWGQD
jgi:general stress protein YciG